MDYTACTQCGMTDTKHMGKGLCRRCYFARYNVDNLAAVKRYKRKWYLKNGAAAWSKLKREQRHYSNNRQAALKRDGFQCVRCKSTRQLCVHHKDGKGRNVPIGQKNNALENLETLCRRCHMEAHRNQILAVRAAAGFPRRSGLTYKNSKRK
jgi:hypothetical protein